MARHATALRGVGLAALAAVGLVASPAGAQSPAFLVKDVNAIATPRSSSPGPGVVVGGRAVFGAGTESRGRETWASDGTPGGTVLLSDRWPGADSGLGGDVFVPDPVRLIAYFVGRDPERGRELWKTDGTSAGTTLVKEIQPGPTDGMVSLNAVVRSGQLYFAAGDPTTGLELWRSNSSTAGTLLVTDIQPGATGSQPSSFASTGTAVFFSASTTSAGRELWKTDGTPAGTVLVRDVRSGTADGISSSAPFVALGGILYFVADDGSAGPELWRSDGTAAGTYALTALSAVVVERLAVSNGKLFFQTRQSMTSNPGYELWTSDGTAGGTASFLFGYGLCGDVFAHGGATYFSADVAGLGCELFRTDGTTPGTEFLKDIGQGVSGNPRGFFSLGPLLYFTANDGASGSELWRTDGTPAGTVQAVDIAPGASSGAPSVVASLGGVVLLAASDGTNDRELWRSDGSAAGTALVADIALDVGSSDPSDLTELDGGLVFAANDGVAGREPWVSLGSANGTERIADVNPGAAGSSPSELVERDHALLFAATTAAQGRRLWITTGDVGVASLVSDVPADPSDLTLFAGDVFFAGDPGGDDAELWRSDGTPGGTTQVFTTSWPNVSDLTPAAGLLFFLGQYGFGTLYQTDGTPAGTVQTPPATNFPGCHSPSSPTSAGSRLFYFTFGDFFGSTLCVTDGVTSTALAFFGYYGLSSTSRTALGDDLIFSSSIASVTGSEPWLSDGTQAGTALLKDVWPGASSSNASDFITVGPLAYFTATDGSTARTLWKTNGTPAGTARVKTTGTLPTQPSALRAVGDKLVFSACDASAGCEPWVSDGTDLGTFRVADVVPGATSSNPDGFTAAGNLVYFSAWDDASGRELWALPAASLLPSVAACGNGVDDDGDGLTDWPADPGCYDAGWQLESPACSNGADDDGDTLVDLADPTCAGNAWQNYEAPPPSGCGLLGIEGVAALALARRLRSRGRGRRPGRCTMERPRARWLSILPGVACAIGLLGTAPAASAAQPNAYLVSDLNRQTGPVLPTSFGVTAPLSGRALFFAATPEQGYELWSSDGTAAGTAMVREIGPGERSGSPGSSLVPDGAGTGFYFAGDDGDHGVELWWTDGTAAGSRLVADVSPGATSSLGRPALDLSLPVGILTSPTLTGVASGGVLFFQADDGVHGPELWRSDGTAAGTWLVADLEPGPAGSYPHAFGVAGGRVFFAADTAAQGVEPWSSDGTLAGTVALGDLYAGTSDSNPGIVAALGARMFFSAYSSAFGSTLFQSDGTPGGTTPVTPLSGTPPNNVSRYGFALNGLIFFTRSVSSPGSGELWRTDGTPLGTVLFRSVPGTFEATPIVDGNVAWFPLYDSSTNVRQLWRSDGTIPGTYQITGFSYLGSPFRAAVRAGQLYFSASSPASSNQEPWVSNGTPAGTRQITEIATGTKGSSPDGFVPVGTHVLFSAADAAGDRELWRTDATAAGTALVAELSPEVGSSDPGPFVALDDLVLFPADNGVAGRELWRSTSTGLGLLQDLYVGASSSSPFGLTRFGDEALFGATSSGATGGTHPWKTDGTAGGTTQLSSTLWLSPGPPAYPLDPSFWVTADFPFTPLGGVALFPGRNHIELWATDGTAAGTVFVADPSPNDGYLYLGNQMRVCGGRVFGDLVQSHLWSVGYGLWTSDGTTAGTQVLAQFLTPRSLTCLGGTLYLFGNVNSATIDPQLWRSDGTAGGTSTVLTLPRNPAPDTSWLTALGTKLLLPGRTTSEGLELWESDGTAAGTQLLADLAPGPASSAPTYLATMGGRVYFAASDGTGPVTLWSTDGSAAGTAPVRTTGTLPRTPAHAEVIDGNRLVFSACDDAAGCEPWVSDGTEIGTFRVEDAVPGPASSNPREFARAGTLVYFSAFDAARGRELWAFPEFHLSPPACRNGLDDDGDGMTDWPADPGCADAEAAPENPACSNGADDDGDGFVDLADPTCAGLAYRTYEVEPAQGCGLLGIEAAALLAACGAVGGRSRARRQQRTETPPRRRTRASSRRARSTSADE